MKIALVSTGNWQRGIIKPLQDLGHEVVEIFENADVMINNSVAVMPRAWDYIEAYPTVPVITYCWDIYSWVLTRKRGPWEYDYVEYRRLCDLSLETWVPSKAVQNSAVDFWGKTDTFIIKPFVPVVDYLMPQKRDYAFQALRMNPDDRMDWFERACKETGTPYKLTNPDKPLPEAEYRPLLANAKCLVSPIYEMSTGGLFLWEGAIWEKPILCSNSPYHGAVDFFGETIAYFQHDDFEDFKDKLKKIYSGELKTDTKAASILARSYTPETMAFDIHTRLNQIL